MAASYPSTIRSFSTKRNVLDVIDAADPNSLQEEVVAIESIIGINPNISTSPSSTGTFATTSTSYTNLTQRLANIETGIVSDSHTQYIRRTGNEVIVNSAASNIALSVKGAANQTADLQQWRDSANNVLAKITASGGLTVSSLDSVDFQNQIIAGLWD